MNSAFSSYLYAYSFLVYFHEAAQQGWRTNFKPRPLRNYDVLIVHLNEHSLKDGIRQPWYQILPPQPLHVKKSGPPTENYTINNFQMRVKVRIYNICCRNDYEINLETLRK